MLENSGPPASGTEPPGDRLSRLSAASLRINEGLDFDTVLQGVLDSTRPLTAARYGVMTLLDDAGGVQDLLSSGMTGEEAGQLWLTPDRWRLFGSLTGISEPVRVPDLEEGATDYVVKPFPPTELVARVRAALRRFEEPRHPEPAGVFLLGDLAIDYERRRVTLSGDPVDLTAMCRFPRSLTQ